MFAVPAAMMKMLSARAAESPLIGRGALFIWRAHVPLVPPHTRRLGAASSLVVKVQATGRGAVKRKEIERRVSERERERERESESERERDRDRERARER